jgi:hypothetical protein
MTYVVTTCSDWCVFDCLFEKSYCIDLRVHEVDEVDEVDDTNVWNGGNEYFKLSFIL